MTSRQQSHQHSARAVRRVGAQAAALSVEHLTADLSRRTVHGGIQAVIAQVLRVLIQLAFMALLARLLPPSDFGLVAMASTVVTFVGIFAYLGLSAATVQQEKISQSLVSTLFYINLAMGFALMVLVMAAAPLIARFYGDARVKDMLIVLALGFPVGAAGVQHGALLQRAMHWAPLQWTPVVSQIASGLTAVLLAWKFGLGHWALVAQIWIPIGLTTVSMWWFCAWRPDFHFDLRRARSALGFGLNMAGYSFVDYFHRQLDNVLIGWRWGATSLGYYNRAYQLLLLPLTLVHGPVGFAVVPALSRLQDDPERWRRAFLKAFSAVNLASSAVTAIMIAIADPLVRLLFGPGWQAAANIFVFLSISMFASTPLSAAEWIYSSRGHASRLLRWSLMVTPCYAFAYLIGLPFGPAGVAICYSISVTLAVLPGLAYAAAGSPVRFHQLLRAALPSAIVGIAAAVAGHWVSLHFLERGVMTSLVAGGITAGLVFSIAAIPLTLLDTYLVEILKAIWRFVRQQFGSESESNVC